MNIYFRVRALILGTLIGCQAILTVSAAEEEVIDKRVSESDEPEVAHLLSAFFGLDNNLPFRSNLLCLGAWGKDGMPVIFSHTLDPETLDEDDFSIETRSGKIYNPMCATLRPADDEGENRTVLLIGEFGTAVTDPPISVSVVGNLQSDGVDGTPIDFESSQIAVIPLDSGPALILAESVPKEVWAKERRGTMCPDESRQVIRVTWTGGVRLPTGAELGETERSLYRVELEKENGQKITIEPDYLADLEDSDNNHLLCLSSENPVISVSFPAGHLVDPNRDLNLESSVPVL
jgi:hypothetical protein